jgi:hypothetical protein
MPALNDGFTRTPGRPQDRLKKYPVNDECAAFTENKP